jgi:hypothetical protein
MTQAPPGSPGGSSKAAGSVHNATLILPVPEIMQGQVDLNTWGRLMAFDNIESPTAEQINSHIGFLIECWRQKDRTGQALWYEFTTEFDTWGKEEWTKVPPRTAKYLRSYLIGNGVFVDTDGARIAANLEHAAQRPSFRHWTADELNHQLKRSAELKQRVTDPKFAAEIQGLDEPWQPQPTPTTGLTPTPQLRESSQTRENLQTNWPPIPQHQQVPRENTPLRQPTSYRFQSTPFLNQDPPQQPQVAKQLTDLTKLYSNDDMKYSGDTYEVLDSKLLIFYDCCHRLGIPQWQFAGAFPTMLKGRALSFYYDRLCGTPEPRDFDTMVSRVKGHFENQERNQTYLTDWRNTTLSRIISENPDMSKIDCLDLLFDKLTKIQRALPTVGQSEEALRIQLLNACRSVRECTFCLYSPAATLEGVRSQLRSAISLATDMEAQQFAMTTSEDLQQFWTDRTYNGRGRATRFGNGRTRGNPRRGKFTPGRSDKKCYVCGKSGCWSTTHTTEERRQAYDRFKNNRFAQDKSASAYAQFLAWHEGIEGVEDSDEDDSVAQFFQSPEDDEIPDEEDGGHVHSTFFNNSAPADAYRITALLADAAVLHGLTGRDPFEEQEPLNANFTLEGRYSATTFHGIMPDSGAAGVSTAGHPQFKALQREQPSLTLDQSTAGEATIKFGSGQALTSLGTTTVSTPLGPMDFHVVPTDTPFLLCLQDMDRLGIKFDNLKNHLQQGDRTVPVVRKWGHPWLQLDVEKAITYNYLTEGELRRLHRRFGHPSVARLHKVLQRAGHPVEIKALELLTKVCHQCQMNAARPARFKFTLHDDCEFNYEVVMDIMYLEGNRPTLHVVDTATAFNAARFLKDITSKNVWEALRLCWIDVYQGPPDWIVTDAGTSFRSAEFRQQAKEMAISLKEVPIEAHNSIGKVERYHAPLRRAYEILRAEDPSASPEAALQMAVKAINDTAGPDGIVPTLLVFGAYPRLTQVSAPSPGLRQRALAIQKATEAVRKLHAERQVSEALAARNGPNTSRTTQLPVGSLVRVWREKNGWQGPYKLLATNDEDCTIETDRGQATFRSTVVKPYYEDQSMEATPTTAEDPTQATIVVNVAPERGGDTPEGLTPPKRGRGRPRKVQPAQVFLQETDVCEVFLTNKEQADAALAVQLRAEGKITTPGAPFEKSAQAEIDSLISRGVFEFVRLNEKDQGTRIFKSRIVNEIKGKTTDAPYEKSRLVVQGYGDDGKEAILTQSPTIQRASQRLILALMPSLLRQNMVAWLRDITQAYVQSETWLNRKILAYLPTQIRHLYPEGTVMRVVKPLYGLAEAGTHWWATYHNHHLKKLQMVTSTYDPCLLISAAENPDFACIGMQTDDTLGLSTTTFSQREEEQLKEAAFSAKPKQLLTVDEPLIFNGGIVTLTGSTITLRQKGQATKLQPIDANAPNAKQQYVEQRARGAYIASICQPEACFDLSSAAQHQDPTPDDIKALNRRIRWQMESQDRGIAFLPLDLPTAKLFVFVDGSFANNRDLTSQLGFAIILANEAAINDRNEFTITGNLIHFSSTKSKRITRSVLASEIYGMVAGVDMAYALASTLQMITTRLSLPPIPTIVCTDSYSLYECLVKLGTTKEKRLMIDIMALRQSYERRELQEVRWIHGDDNLADAFTKGAPNRSLERFVDSNSATVRVEGWVSR